MLSPGGIRNRSLTHSSRRSDRSIRPLMVRRLLLALALLAAVPFVGLPAWIAVRSRDLPDPGDSDLLLAVPELAAADDAYVGFQQAVDAMAWDDTKESHARLKAAVAGEADDPTWIESLVRANEPAFLRLERALDAPGIAIPPYSFDGGDDGFEVFGPLLTLARIAAVDARALAREGRVDDAVERALIGTRIGRKISEAARPQIVSMAVAGALQRISLGEIVFLVSDVPFSAGRANALARRLEDLRWNPDAWRRAWASEYLFIREVVETLEAQEASQTAAAQYEGPGSWVFDAIRLLPREYSFQPNRTLSLFASLYRDLGAQHETPCLDGWRGEEQRDHPTTLDLLLSPNPAGRIIFEISRPNFLTLGLLRCESATQVSLVRTLLALHAYRQDHDRLPAHLAALVPDYLDAVPLDQLDGEAIRWSPEHAVLYSIGRDFSDDGPPEEPSLSEREAPAVRLPTTS